MGVGRRRGHTLLEMVTVLAVSALLAGVAITKFIDMGTVGSFTAARRLAADIRYAQRLATATHQPCGVVISSGSTYTVFQGSSATPALDPLIQQPMVVNIGDSSPNVSLSPTGGGVTFDVRGRPQSGFTPSISAGTRTLVIAPETGEVRY